MNGLIEQVFPVAEHRIPLDCAPLRELPRWGRWLETPDLIAAMLPPGQIEVNLLAPFEFISTRFQPGYGLAAFNTDQLMPYQSQPGGFDVVPQNSTYRSVETTGVCIVLAYKQPLAARIMAEYTDATIELIPGQVQTSSKGMAVAQALHAFFTDTAHLGGALHLESLAALIMGHVIRQQTAVTKRLKHVPDCLTPKQLKIIIEYIQSQLQSELRLNQMATHLGISPYYLAHAFKATTGLSPHQYVLRCRLEQAQRLLRHTQMPVAAVAYEVGFGSHSHMTTVFRKALQITPSLYRQQATS